MIHDTVCAKEVLVDSSQTAHFNLKSQLCPLTGKHRSPFPEPQHSVVNVKEPKIQ